MVKRFKKFISKNTFKQRAQQSSITLGLISLWAICTLQLSGGLVKGVVSTLFLLLVPGYFAKRLFTTASTHTFSEKLSYIVGLSLLILMLTGLALNQLYIFLGKSNPLSPKPLVISIALVSFIISQLGPQKFVSFKRFHFKRSSISKFVLLLPIILSGLALPGLAILGAVSLNNGGSGNLSLLTMFGAGLLVLIMSFRHKDLAVYYPWLLYSLCLSLLLVTSLRGWNITGHDILQEFQVFQLTLRHQEWRMAYYQDAYMACLSLTILPTIFKQLTAIQDQYIYRLLYQMVFALIAPIIYGLLRPYISKRLSFLATFLFLTFPTFLTDITMLNRQEIALLFLTLSLHVGLDRKASKTSKYILSFLFLLGMILSHYSTSYVAITGLVISLVLELAWILVRKYKRPKVRSACSANVLYPATVIIAASFILFGWGTYATHTSKNIVHTVKNSVTTISTAISTQKLPHANSNLPQHSAVKSLSGYEQEMKKNRKLPIKSYFSEQIIANYPLKPSSPTISPPTLLSTHSGVKNSLWTILYNFTRSSYAIFIQIAIFGGLIVLAFSQKVSKLPRQYLFFGTGLLVVVGTQFVLPTAINYGVTRILQQSLLLLALPCILTMLWILKLLRVPVKLREGTVTIILVGFFAVLSGFLPALTGNYKPVLALSNSGFYYGAYYTHKEEIGATRWLQAQAPKGSRIYSDEFSRRKIITYGSIYGEPTLSPVAIPIDSYVYISNSNTSLNQVSGYSPAYVGSKVFYYQPPTDFLNANKNLVYNSQKVVIYK